MTARIVIRPYKPGDDLAARKIANRGAMSTVPSFFESTATREFVSQVVLMLSAVLFIVVGLPFQYCLLSLPLTFGGIYLAIWIGHRIKIMTTHIDLNNIDKTYSKSEKCGFWVAELISNESNAIKTPKETDYDFVRENSQHCESGGNKAPGKLIGTIAICVKDDPDMRDAPGTIAWLRRMAVDPAHQRRGVGSALLEAALDHCASHDFDAVELITSENHEVARSLYYKKGFELIGSYKKRFAGGLVGLYMYQLQKRLKAKDGSIDEVIG